MLIILFIPVVSIYSILLITSAYLHWEVLLLVYSNPTKTQTHHRFRILMVTIIITTMMFIFISVPNKIKSH